jgi:hypothetical protein
MFYPFFLVADERVGAIGLSSSSVALRRLPSYPQFVPPTGHIAGTTAVQVHLFWEKADEGSSH